MYCITRKTFETKINLKSKIMKTNKRPTSIEMLNLIKKLPDAENHIHICPINGKQCVTSEFFAGTFAGRAFDAETLEKATEQLIDYMYEHIGHDSIVGKFITESGFPDMNKLYEYCKPVSDEYGS